jgi:hypothetical protein
VKKRFTLEQFVALEHIQVAPRGKPGGYLDDVLRERGLSRTVARAVPYFVTALQLAAETDYVLTISERIARRFAEPLVARAPRGAREAQALRAEPRLAPPGRRRRRRIASCATSSCARRRRRGRPPRGAAHSPRRDRPDLRADEEAPAPVSVVAALATTSSFCCVACMHRELDSRSPDIPSSRRSERHEPQRPEPVQQEQAQARRDRHREPGRPPAPPAGPWASGGRS